jgi:hypothetical protein
MTTRDELAGLMLGMYRIEPPTRALEMADDVLSRWRLVPVEEQRTHTRVMVWVRNQKPANICNVCGADWPCETASEEQHRAADELTQHDQAAGHYRDDLAAGLYVPPRRRTDEHGPHGD